MLILHLSPAIIVVLTDLHPVSFRFLLLNMICLLLAVAALRYYFFVLENRFSKLNYQVLLERDETGHSCISAAYDDRLLRVIPSAYKRQG